MLTDKFKHPRWFKGDALTKQNFLNYVLSNSSDFYIKNEIESHNLFDYEVVSYLSDGRYTYKLSEEECEYLSEHNEYFKSKLE